MNPFVGDSVYTFNQGMAFNPVPRPTLPGFVDFSGQTGINPAKALFGSTGGTQIYGDTTDSTKISAGTINLIQWGIDKGKRLSPYIPGMAMFTFVSGTWCADSTPRSRESSIGGDVHRINAFLCSNYMSVMRSMAKYNPTPLSKPPPSATQISRDPGGSSRMVMVETAAAPASPAPARVKHGIAPGQDVFGSDDSVESTSGVKPKQSGQNGGGASKDVFAATPDMMWPLTSSIATMVNANKNVMWTNLRYIRDNLRFAGIVLEAGKSDGIIGTPTVAYARSVPVFDYWPMANMGDRVGFVVTLMHHVAGVNPIKGEDGIDMGNCPVIVPWHAPGHTVIVSGTERVFKALPSKKDILTPSGFPSNRRTRVCNSLIESVPLYLVGVCQRSAASNRQWTTNIDPGSLHKKSLQLCGINLSTGKTAVDDFDGQSQQRLVMSAKTGLVAL